MFFLDVGACGGGTWEVGLCQRSCRWLVSGTCSHLLPVRVPLTVRTHRVASSEQVCVHVCIVFKETVLLLLYIRVCTRKLLLTELLGVTFRCFCVLHARALAVRTGTLAGLLVCIAHVCHIDTYPLPPYTLFTVCFYSCATCID